MNYRYIAIEGNIGAGKSTLAQSLSRHYAAGFMPERFEDNPFLPLFYKDAVRYAFTLELSFLEDRFQQVMETIRPNTLLISDYLWAKSLVFARVNLKDEELALFERLYTTLTASLPSPDAIIYLHRPTDQLLGHINRRGRTYEQDIKSEYLMRVEAEYRRFFAQKATVPVFWLEKPPSDADKTFLVVQKLLEKPVSPGFYSILDESGEMIVSI